MKLWALALFVLMGCNPAGGASGIPLEVGDRFVTDISMVENDSELRKKCQRSGITVEAVHGAWIRYTNRDEIKVWITPDDWRASGVIICPKQSSAKPEERG